MPKPKRGDRSTPPPVRIVIKELPPLVKASAKPKPATVPAADPEPPHYY